MIRPLNEFAGWLRFFQIIVFMNIVFSVFFGFTLFETLFRQPDKLLTLGEIAQLGFILFMLYGILKIIQNQDAIIPEKIKENLFNIFLIAIIHLLFFTSVTLLVYGREWMQSNTIAFIGAFQTMVWTAFWRTYFEKSKRVKAYYSNKIDLIV